MQREAARRPAPRPRRLRPARSAPAGCGSRCPRGPSTSAPRSGHTAGSGNRTSMANCVRQPRHSPATVSRRSGNTGGRCAPSNRRALNAPSPPPSALPRPSPPPDCSQPRASPEFSARRSASIGAMTSPPPAGSPAPAGPDPSHRSPTPVPSASGFAPPATTASPAAHRRPSPQPRPCAARPDRHPTGSVPRSPDVLDVVPEPNRGRRNHPER